MFCHRAIAELVAIIPEITARGARLVFVGTDPERESFRAAEMKRGFAKVFLNGGSVSAYRDARSEGHRITGLFGDLTLVMLHRSQFAGDHVGAKTIIDALASAQ